ncbi:MAG: KGG domain-containing protein [Polyangiales bacterium]
MWTPEKAREAGRKGGRAPRKPRVVAAPANDTADVAS